MKIDISLEESNLLIRLRNIDQARKDFIEEKNQNDVMSRKAKKVCTTWGYIEHLLISASAVTECVSISVFASLAGIAIGITSSAVGLKVCAKTAENKKNHKIILLAKTKLNTIEDLTFRNLIDSYSLTRGFVSVSNMLREYDDVKEKIKNIKILTVHQRF